VVLVIVQGVQNGGLIVNLRALRRPHFWFSCDFKDSWGVLHDCML